MTDLSILIPARNEMFLKHTIDSILSTMRADTEVIAILDGAWANPPIADHSKVTLVYHPNPVGQRAATNEAARIARGKYLMKLDAHCIMDEGFDAKLLADMNDRWTVVPTMKNLHAFDWVCANGHRRYQSPSGPCSNISEWLKPVMESQGWSEESLAKAMEVKLETVHSWIGNENEPNEVERNRLTDILARVPVMCGKPTYMDIIWKAKPSPNSNSYCFDPTPHFQYFREYNKRPEGRGDLTESMSLQGSCFMMTRERYFYLNACDENFGSWGSQGIEVAVKTWLSGGKVMVNHKTWYAHLFRTQGGDFGFPYHMSNHQVDHAKQCVRDTFFTHRWEKAVYPLTWLVQRFWPVPGWTEEDLCRLKESSTTPA